MRQLRWVFVGGLLGLALASNASADVKTISIYNDTSGINVSTELIRSKKLIFSSTDLQHQVEIGIGYSFPAESWPLTISPNGPGQGIAPEHLNLTTMIAGRFNQNESPVLNVRTRLDWSLENKQDFDKPRYYPTLFEFEPGLIFQAGQGVVQHIVSRITLFSPKMSSRQFGIEYILDFYPPARPTDKTFRVPGRQNYRPIDHPHFRVTGQENWFVTWNVPTGYLRLAFNKSRVVSMINNKSAHGGLTPGLDWQIRYVYRRYKF